MANNIRVVHLTSVHTPMDTRIFQKECKTLASAGYDVTLVAADDRSQTVDGIHIGAVPRPSGRLERMTRTLYRVYRAALRENGQIYHFHDPELIPVGLKLKLLGKRVVYDVHEDVPSQILGKYWLKPKLRKWVAMVAAYFESMGMRAFDGIVAATPVIARRFPPHKTITVQNFPRLDALLFINRPEDREKRCNMAYVGTISGIRGIREMVRALELVSRDHQIRLVMAGKFWSEELSCEVSEMSGWQHVEFRGWQSYSEVNKLLTEVCAGLILFHPAPNHVRAQPNKLFEYMAAGIPVIASDFPLWREIIDDAKCGLLVDPLDPMAIAKAMIWILENPREAWQMGKNGQDAVHNKYNWDQEAAKLLALYKALEQ